MNLVLLSVNTDIYSGRSYIIEDIQRIYPLIDTGILLEGKDSKEKIKIV